MARKEEKKVSLSRRIVSLTVFIDVIFLIIISAGFLFYTFIIINQNRTQVVQNQTQAIVSSTERFLNEIKQDVDLLTKNTDVIEYLNYINEGNNPLIETTEANYHLYYDFLAITTALVDHQAQNAYDWIFLATEFNCLDATDGCAITSSGQLLYETWFINQRPWFQDLGTNIEKLTSPYEDALSGEYTFTYVKRILDGEETIGYLGFDMSLESLGVLVDSIDKDVNGEVAELLIFTDFETYPTLVFFNKDNYTDYSLKSRTDFLTIDNESGYSGGGNLAYMSGFVNGVYQAGIGSVHTETFGLSGAYITMVANNAFAAVTKNPDTGVMTVVDPANPDTRPDFYVYLIGVTNGQITMSEVEFSYKPQQMVKASFSSIQKIDFIYSKLDALDMYGDIDELYQFSLVNFGYDLLSPQKINVNTVRNSTNGFEFYLEYYTPNSTFFYFDILNYYGNSVTIYVENSSGVPVQVYPEISSPNNHNIIELILEVDSNGAQSILLDYYYKDP